MGRIGMGVRFVAATCWLLFVLVGPLVNLTIGSVLPPDPSASMTLVGASMVVSIVAGALFVVRNGSFSMLGKFTLALIAVRSLLAISALAAVALAEFVVGAALPGGSESVFPSVGPMGFTAVVLAAYALTYHAVYRDGYTDLRTRFTS